MKRRNISRGKIFAFIYLLCFVFASTAFAFSTELVSVPPEGVIANGMSNNASISADGRYVAFASTASNLVQSDTNGTWDVFVFDRETGIVERVSVNSQGIQGDKLSTNPSISGDGRYVAFESYSTNLSVNDTAGYMDIFVYDRQTGEVERLGANSAGIGGDNHSKNASISYDGRFIAFESAARNLVPDDNNGTWDVFVYDRKADTIELISSDQSGIAGQGASRKPSISADGRFVTFESYAYNLVPGDSGILDVFVYDRQDNIMELVSVRSDGGKANGPSMNSSISNDGRYIVFSSNAINLVDGDTNFSTDVYLHDRMTGITERISIVNGDEGNGASDFPALSPDGRYIAFESKASNLILGDTNGMADVIVLDRAQNIFELVSVDSDGFQGSSTSGKPAISQEGSFIAFESNSINLDPRDTRGTTDVFIRDRRPDNVPPVADAGSDQMVNCTGVNGTEVTLDGSGSSDPDGDELTYVWSGPIIGSSVSGMTPTITLPLGTYEFKLTVNDGNGGTESDSVVITVEDLTPPSTSAMIASGIKGMLQSTNGSDWFNSDVQVLLTASDNCAGCETIYTALDGAMSAANGSTRTIAIGTEGIHELMYWSVDGAGNTESEKSEIIRIDKTVPAISAQIDPAPNDAGWNSTDVTVNFICSDALSGIEKCPGPVTVTSEGAGQEVSGTVSDNAGNTISVSIVVNIDKSVPTLSITADPKYLWPPNGKMKKVNISAVTTSAIQSATIRVVDEYGKIQPVIHGLSGTVKLKAWRKKKDKDGRHYTIIAEVVDTAGNVSTATTEVIVPHDMKHHKRHHKDKKGDHDGNHKDQKDHHGKKDGKKGKNKK